MRIKGEIVRDEEQPDVELTLEVGKDVDDRGLNGDVQCGCDLVADEQLRVRDQRAGDRCPLALASRQLMRVPIEHRARELDGLEGFPFGVVLPSGQREEDSERLADDLPDRLPRVERVVRALEDVLDLASNRRVARA